MNLNPNTSGQVQTVNFVGTVTAGAGKTLVSQQFRRPFRLWLIRPHFELNQNRKVKLYFFISPDDSEPTSYPTSGFDILSESSKQTYVIGDDEYKELYVDARAKEGNNFLKVYAENSDVFDHTIDVQMFIELLEDRS